MERSRVRVGAQSGPQVWNSLTVLPQLEENAAELPIRAEAFRIDLNGLPQERECFTGLPVKAQKAAEIHERRGVIGPRLESRAVVALGGFIVSFEVEDVGESVMSRAVLRIRLERGLVLLS